MNENSTKNDMNKIICRQNDTNRLKKIFIYEQNNSVKENVREIILKILQFFFNSIRSFQCEFCSNIIILPYFICQIFKCLWFG